MKSDNVLNNFQVDVDLDEMVRAGFNLLEKAGFFNDSQPVNASAGCALRSSGGRAILSTASFGANSLGKGIAGKTVLFVKRLSYMLSRLLDLDPSFIDLDYGDVFEESVSGCECLFKVIYMERELAVLNFSVIDGNLESVSLSCSVKGEVMQQFPVSVFVLDETLANTTAKNIVRYLNV